MKDYTNELKQLNNDIDLLTKDLPMINEQIHELEVEAGMPGFWDNLVFATNETRKLERLKIKANALWQMRHDFEDFEIMSDWALSGAVSNEELAEAFDTLVRQVAIFKEALLLTGKYDKENAIITLHAGSGGDEACDFSDMMLRAINRWAESCNFKVRLTDVEPNKVAGIASATLIVEGDNAYGYAKALNGVFRLVRISPFDAAGRRHTSFMAIDVVPQFTDNSIIEVKIEDCDMDTFRSGGCGGQYQNKTDSGVRLTHRPTGFIVECREERSQLQNKNRCLEKLRAMIFHKQEEERTTELNGIRGEKTENGWGSAICSIVLMPYQLVKDNRTGWETSNTTAFLNGDFNGFIRSYLGWLNSKEKGE